ncbi:hydroxysqualene dehydroxylase [Gordonia westfalica]|uniref:Tat (Twin-arginine translocation) pathway signal sequence n=1 Tax=Gordonia westfalica TaxID=158898 RepID=A0A1H2LXI9_9ACTN|nr:FAD-dependent oxidoreductase [Gordonia westfalica]SDU85006.1 Tat (twin-arginine translocation) pathway signal sequence [Gordonia westfalica]
MSDDQQSSVSTSGDGTAREGFSRRTVLRGSAAAAVLAGTATALPHTYVPSAQAVPRTGSGRGRDVAIFGGGMAGLSAAHELVERGFAVTVYEPAYLGGKARSHDVPGTASGGRLALPGEHGFRFFPSCYQHVPEMMERIPVGRSNVRERHLISVESAMIAFDESGYAPTTAPASILGFVDHAPEIVTLENLRNAMMTGLKFVVDVPLTELAFFVSRELVMATSCNERRIGQWENQSWMQFVKAKGKSRAYQRYLVGALTRALVAAKPESASARTIGQIGLALTTAASGLIPQYESGLFHGDVDRILNRPTNHAWIDPWVAHLRSRGVRFVMGAGLAQLDVARRRITGARLTTGTTVESDWYVAAMPIDRLKPLLSPELVSADPSLAGIHQLQDDWMVGIQYFLSRRSELPPGHIAALGTPWALTGLYQAPPWKVDFSRKYGDGRVKDCLSIDISEWEKPGILYGKPAKQCTKQEIAREVWAQMSRAMNAGGRKVLRSADIVTWSLDPGITWSPTIANATPLMVNTAGSYANRPNAHTKIPNLFIGGDHVRSNIDLATMEGANESGRRVTNAIIAAADSPARNAALFPLWELPMLDPLKQIDRDRYRAGLPHILDV